MTDADSSERNLRATVVHWIGAFLRWLLEDQADVFGCAFCENDGKSRVRIYEGEHGVYTACDGCMERREKMYPPYGYWKVVADEQR